MFTADDARNIGKTHTDFDSVFEIYEAAVRDAAQKLMPRVRLQVPTVYFEDVKKRFSEQGFVVDVEQGELIVGW